MTPRQLLAAVLLTAVAGPPRTDTDRVDLFTDDFSRFAPGVLSAPIGTLNGAIQEYHYIEHRGVRTVPWRNPLVHLDTWAAGDDSEGPYLEQHTINTDARFNPLFVTGEPEWRDYTVEVSVQPLSLDQFAGVAVRYLTSRRYYRVALEGGTHLRLSERLPFDREFRVSAWRPIAEAAFRYDTKTWYRLGVEVEGNRIIASVDGQPLLDVRDDALKAGIAGLTANMPARFRRFRVTARKSAAADVHDRIGKRQAELRRLRAQNPQPTLWKKFSTPGFGAGRNVRVGDLDGDGRLDLLFAQNVPKVRGDAFDHISCLTAVTLDGKVLWQLGRPNPKNGLLTNDTPFQIHDLDADGRPEIVLARDFQLQVLDGRNGKLLRKAWLPPVAPTLENRPYELNNGDSILFLDSDGNGHADDILLKDRYTGLWVFDKDLRLKWSGEANTGHYPFPLDVDGDRRDEFVIGYSMWGSDGRRRWGHDDTVKDHADAISIGRFTGREDEPPRAYIDGSDEGFLMLDAVSGRILRQHRLGHAQTQSVGRFRTDLPGLQILIANFWRNAGIVTALDADANILAQEEMIPGSSHLQPVNWRGDGTEFALLSGNVREGGMIDGHLRRVVMFPDDGHPDLAATVHDLTGDARDEIVLWDQERVWIYTQDRPFKGDRIYKPRRNPTYNDSNYRANVSLPGWMNVAETPRAPRAVSQSRPPRCPGCRPLFDGRTLQGWAMEKPDTFVVREGAIASTGPGSHLWTAQAYLDYRLFFTVRQVGFEPGKGHRPSVTFLGQRPDPASSTIPRGLSGIQLQPPHGGSWDYRKSGQDGDPRKHSQFYRRPDPRPTFDDKKWHRCEVLVKGSVGSFTAACCEIEGKADCRATEVLAFQDPALAGSKGPFCIQIHNSGLYDEYKDIYIDDRPRSDALITTR